MTRDEFFAQKAKGALWDVGVSIQRGNPLPLDSNSVFESKAKADAYVAGVLAYPGQIIAVVEASATTIYYIDQAMALQEVGKIPLGDDKSIKVDAATGKISILGVDTAETGAQPVKQADGSIKWIKPDTTTVEGLSKAIENLEGRIDPIEKTEYGIEKLAKSTDGMLATYQLYKTVDGGAKTYFETKIDIPKDLVVESGTVKTYATKTEATTDGMSANQAAIETFPGTFIKLTIANKTSDNLFINVSGLIEYVTSGSADGDDIVITVSADHKVTATLSSAIKTSLGKADSALQAVDITVGKTNGTIAVKGTDVKVTGLADAAYTTVKSIEDKIATAKSEAIADAGTAADAKIATKVGEIGDKTVKAYTDDAVSAVESKVDDLTTSVGALDLKALAHLDTVDEAHLEEKLAAKINGKATKATTLEGYGITDAMTKTAIEGAISTAKTEAATDATSKANAAKTAVIGTAGDTADDDTVKGAKAYADSIGTNLKGTVVGKSTDKSSADTIYGAKAYADDKANAAKTAAEKTAADALSPVSAKATANETAIATLNGTGAGSVSKKITDAIADLDVTDTAKTGEFVTAVSETDGKISVSRAALKASDIPNLTTAKLTDFATEMAKKQNSLEFMTPPSSDNKVATAADLTSAVSGLSGAMHYIGTSSKDPTLEAGPTVEGHTGAFVSGDVVVFDKSEYVYDGTSWRELGSEDSYVLKGTKFTNSDIADNAAIAQSKIAGLTADLGKKLDATTAASTYVAKEGYVAYTQAEKTKLAGIAEKAQVNVLESIATPDGDLTATSKKVTIPAATATKLGLVKGSAAENKVAVAANGEMEVNSLNVNKLTQTAGDTLILNCGTSKV